MVQGRRGAGFLEEATAAILLGDILGGQELKGHDPLQFIVEGLVDCAHTASADWFDDTVMGNGFCGNGLHVGCHRLSQMKRRYKRIILPAWSVRAVRRIKVIMSSSARFVGLIWKPCVR